MPSNRLLLAATALALAATGVALWCGSRAQGAPGVAAPTGGTRAAVTAPDVEPPATLPAERADVAEAPVEELQARRYVEAARARVHLRGQLLATRGLGAELDLRLEALDRTEREDSLAAALSTHAPAWRVADRAASDGDADDAAALKVEADADGVIDADISALFVDPAHLPRLLALTVRHENFDARGYMIPARVDGVRIDARMLAHDVDLAIPFEVELVPRCVLRGQAWARDGGTAPIRIEAWSVRDDRLLGLHASDSVANADDEYELQLVPDQRYAIVALAQGLVPLTAIVETSGALDLWNGPLVLDSGASIEGHVGLERHLFGGRATLSLAPQVRDRRNVFGPSGLCWSGASFFPEAQEVQGDSDGHFALAGLVPGRYALRVGVDRARWTEMDAIYQVDAPASTLELDPPLVEVTWQFEHCRRALARHEFRVRGAGKGGGVANLSTDSNGRASAWLLQGEPYVLEVPMGGCGDWTYGKVVPWNRATALELVAMGASD